MISIRIKVLTVQTVIEFDQFTVELRHGYEHEFYVNGWDLAAYRFDCIDCTHYRVVFIGSTKEDMKILNLLGTSY